MFNRIQVNAGPVYRIAGCRRRDTREPWLSSNGQCRDILA